MPCECTRCRQLGRALSSMDAALRRPGLLPAVAVATALLVLVPAVLVGFPFLFALLLGVAAGGALVAVVLRLRPRFEDGADALAPLRVERWLCEHDEDWPWWVLGGVTGFVGLLLVTSPRIALPLLLVGGLLAAVPGVRQQLEGCGRLA